MKVRKIIHGPRDAIQHNWSRQHLRRAHRAVRKFAARPENAKHQDRISLTMLLWAGRQERAYQRFANKTMRRRSYRRRVDRLLFQARITGGRIVHDSRGSRVVPREPQ
jgi:hypothetical protein